MHINYYCLLLLLTLLASSSSSSASSSFQLVQDRRSLIPIFEFGFYLNGKIQVNVTDIKIDGGEATEFIGLFLLRTISSQDAIMTISSSGSTCPFKLDQNDVSDFSRSQTTIQFVDFRNAPQNTIRYAKQITDRPGLWSAYLLNCNVWESDMDGTGAQSGPALSGTVNSFKLNPPNSLLSAGQQYLTWIFFTSALVYCLASIMFGVMLCQEGTQILWIHRLMFALLICIMMDKTFHWVQNLYLENGVDAKAWDAAAYLLTSIKSTLAMTIVALIASGWSFISPILPPKQRKIVLCIIPLQIMANLAQFMVDMLAIGSSSWMTWRNIFPLFDLASFLVILWTILTARAHLLKEAETDDKCEITLSKINLWSRLYALVLGYLYMTRIIAVLLTMVLPYTHLWIATLFIEVVGAWFYSAMGYRFRPVATNPYTQVYLDEDDMDSQTKPETYNQPGTSLEMEQL